MEHEFCHLGCWAVLWKISETTNILLKGTSINDVPRFLAFFDHENMKKPPQKVAYLSRILVVSEIFHNTAQQPKWQNSSSKMWPIDQLYIELGPNQNHETDKVAKK